MKIIENLENLKNIPFEADQENFLKSLRLKLSDHILSNPVKKESLNNFRFSNGLNLLAFFNLALKGMKFFQNGAVTAILVASVLGIASGAAIASQNSIPGETLYPVKILSENVRSSLAFTPESKARIQSDFTAKRVAEVKAIMEQKNSNPEGLDIALANLQKNVALSAAIVEKESQSGTDATKLAKKINDDLDNSENNLKQIFKEQSKNLKSEESSLESKIREAKQADNQTLTQSLGKQLSQKRITRKSLENNWNKNEKTLSESKMIIKKQMSAGERAIDMKKEAEEAIAEAKSNKEDLISEEAQERDILTNDSLNGYNSLISAAEKNFAQEKYDEATNLAEQALSELKNIENKIDENEDKSENSGDSEKSSKQNINSITGKSGKKSTGDADYRKDGSERKDINTDNKKPEISPKPGIPNSLQDKTNEDWAEIH